MALKKGEDAPDFILPSTSESKFQLSENLPCILFFYPKDFTPGCTREACSFRDQFSFFDDLEIKVFGINRDSIETHTKFKKEYNLPFELISDGAGRVVKSYEADIPFVKIIRRITYLITADGKIQSVYEDLFGAKNHIKEMIAALNN